MTAEAGVAAVETSVVGSTPTPVPPLASLAAATPPATTPVPVASLLPNTGRGGQAGWPVIALLAGMLALLIGMMLRARRRVR
jgi:LPXTG-motif cell wall-anchored protein